MDTKYLTLVRKTGGNFSLKNKYRNKVDLSAKNFTCILPETNMTMDKDGYIFICSCEGFLPYPVGHIFDFYRLHDIWNNPVAKKLQENTKAGSTFKFCDLKHCHGPFEEEDPFHDFTINITTDDSCNLQCPSCRNELMYYKSGKQFEKKKSYVKKFLELLDKYKGSVLIEFAGGEPFASKIYSEIIYNYKPNPKHRFTIRSNATLIDQSKFETSTMLKNNIQEFSISIDAGTKDVYNIVRPPGKWETVLDNLQFLKDNNYVFHMTFVVQKNNFKDIINFINLCEKFEVKGFLNPVHDWGTAWGITWPVVDQNNGLTEADRYTNFKRQQVFMPDHELYDEWVKIYNNIITHPWFHAPEVPPITFNRNISISKDSLLIPKK